MVKPIRKLVQFTQQYQSGIAGFERFQEIMNIRTNIIETDDAIKLKNPKGIIEFKKVTFKYREELAPVIKDFSIKIEKGQKIALVGPSGVGKTTITNLIPRFYDVSSGSVRIDGLEIKNITLKSLRENIGFVQQDVIIFFGTIRENIMYGDIEASEESMIEAAKNAQIHDFIMSLPDGYESLVGERGVKLSGGQKQRIAIARVFLKNPPILILDEATSSLDNTTELLIQRAINLLSEGRTTIIVAHRLSTIKSADEILVLTDSGIIERGRHNELLKRDGLYSTLFKAQVDGFLPDDAISDNNF